MQLIALSKKGNLVPAHLAEKRGSYRCLECGSSLRLRGGRQIRHHYYHPPKSNRCRQSGKSMTHLQIQVRLQKILPKGESAIEVSFPEIHRIADLVWETKKIIYEVQCSPIQAEEVAARNRDYASQGYQVIWIFHDRYFNSWRLREAEDELENFPYYYSDIGADGKGIFYDQYALICRGQRKRRLKPLSVSPNRILPLKPAKHYSQRTEKRRALWPFCLQGDLAYCELLGKQELVVAQVKKIEKQRQPPPSPKGISSWIKEGAMKLRRAYLIAFQFLLESLCR